MAKLEGMGDDPDRVELSPLEIEREENEPARKEMLVLAAQIKEKIAELEGKGDDEKKNSAIKIDGKGIDEHGDAGDIWKLEKRDSSIVPGAKRIELSNLIEMGNEKDRIKAERHLGIYYTDSRVERVDYSTRLTPEDKTKSPLIDVVIAGQNYGETANSPKIGVEILKKIFGGIKGVAEAKE